MNKTIVVLANSAKPGGRCLAGKELIRDDEGWQIGSWIRPVTSEKSGAVPEYPMTKALGHIPQLLEIIEIPLLRHSPTPDQPENWLVETPIQPNSWRSHGSFAWEDVRRLMDRPVGLWSEKAHARRVRSGYPQRMGKPASLYLIQPDHIQNIEIWSESNQYGNRTRRRVYIQYAKESHELDIDDIDFQKKYYPKLPKSHEPSIFPKLKTPTETLMCVSLTPEFEKDHCHYKIAAAFFEPPDL